TLVNNATQYRLFQRTNGAGTWAWIHTQNNGLTKNIVGNAPANYEYRAVACNLFGCGPNSGVVTTEVGPPTAAPTLTAPTSSTTGNYTVSWTSVPRADNYKLQQSFNNGAWSSQTLAGTSRVYANQPFGSYRYRVCGLRVS